jgi:pseudouridine synthase
VASRRASEELILQGRVKVNGVTVTELGIKVDAAKDEITVNGQVTEEQGRPIVVMLNKPKGFVSTVSDPHAEQTVMDLVDTGGRRLYPVGRLDKDTKGLILLTDDGELANRLLHPSHEITKVYEVRATGNIDQKSIEKLISGVNLDDGPTLPATIGHVQIGGGQAFFRIGIREGRKRQVRRMVEAVGGKVRELVRVEFAGLKLGTLPEGGWRELSRSETERLRVAAGVGKKPQERKGAR